jgi:hypothetical protein
MTSTTPASDALWDAAGDVMDRPDVTRSTMMGLPCLRVDGAFFASLDGATGDLLVKLSRHRVDELLEAGAGHPFAPAGRRFREWIALPPDAAADWPTFVEEALTHVRATLATTPE